MTSRESQTGTYTDCAFADELFSSLCWLAFLVTENWRLSVEIVCSVFDPEDAYESLPRQRIIKPRRLVAAAAIAAIKAELPKSARRTERAVEADWKRLIEPLSGDCSRRSQFTKAALQQALLAIGIFPRCALLLTVFEGLPIEDAALLLGENEALVRGAVGLALLQLTQNLLGRRGWNRLLSDCRN